MQEWSYNFSKLSTMVAYVIELQSRTANPIVQKSLYTNTVGPILLARPAYDLAIVQKMIKNYQF